MDGWIAGWIAGRTAGRIAGRIAGWMDAWMDEIMFGVTSLLEMLTGHSLILCLIRPRMPSG